MKTRSGDTIVNFGNDAASALHSISMMGERQELGPGTRTKSPECEQADREHAQLLAGIGEEVTTGPPRSARDIRLWRVPAMVDGVPGWEPEVVRHTLDRSRRKGRFSLPTLKTFIPAPGVKCWEPEVLAPGEPETVARAERRPWGWQISLPLPPVYAFEDEQECDPEEVERGCWMAKFRRYKLERQALKRLVPNIRLRKNQRLNVFSPIHEKGQGAEHE